MRNLQMKNTGETSPDWKIHVSVSGELKRIWDKVRSDICLKGQKAIRLAGLLR
jgi:hypothetical protein